LHPQGFAVSSASRATSALQHHRLEAVRSRFCARALALLEESKKAACLKLINKKYKKYSGFPGDHP